MLCIDYDILNFQQSFYLKCFNVLGFFANKDVMNFKSVKDFFGFEKIGDATYSSKNDI